MKTTFFTIGLVTGLMLSLTAQGASRSSANYSIATETLDSGGRRTASAHYSNDASVGGFGGLSTAPAEVLKHGYVGQLYDPSALLLAGAPTNVNEGATAQLSASALLDDATFLALGSSSVGWSVVNAPIAGITAAGLATAARVYADTPGTVGGAYQGLSATLHLQVLNVNPDDFGSYAGDGLPDDWQVKYFGLDNPKAAPTADLDGDGQDNNFERIAGTIPTNAASRFLMSLEMSAPPTVHPQISFSPRWPDRTYTVVASDFLSTASFAPLGDQQTTDNGQVRTITDLDPSASNRFYRVQIKLP